MGAACRCSYAANPDRVMIIGGEDSGVVTATAEIINLADPSPAWRYTQPMNFPRTHGDVVILPDGKTLVIGGHSDMHEHGEQGGEEPPPSSVYEAEMFDPTTETWSPMASMQVPRVYHSTALLLPDGRVLAAGSTGIGALGRTAEIYSPPYPFRGPRPVIAAAPARVTYGESFRIESPDAADIGSVVLIRLSSVTHSVNTDQRHVRLDFAPETAGVPLAEAPSNPALAPPGYYMLFVLTADGVPSTAEMVELASLGPPACGSGVIGEGEECDDGNTADGDGCGATCQVELCFACVGEPSACACQEGSTCGTACGESLFRSDTGGRASARSDRSSKERRPEGLHEGGVDHSGLPQFEVLAQGLEGQRYHEPIEGPEPDLPTVPGRVVQAPGPLAQGRAGPYPLDEGARRGCGSSSISELARASGRIEMAMHVARSQRLRWRDLVA